MSKHTPGPWWEEDGIIYANDRWHGVAEIVNCPTNEVANMVDYDPNSPGINAAREERIIEANARLIAAAPELLDQLQRVRRALWNLVDMSLLPRREYDEEALGIIKEIDRVILKATGGDDGC